MYSPFHELVDLLQSSLAWSADAVLANSERGAVAVKEGWRISTRRVDVVRNAVDLESFAFSPAERRGFRAEHGIPDSAVVFAVVGRLDRIKRQDMFVSAAVELSDESRVFLVIGRSADPVYSSIVQNIAEASTTADIRFLGHSDDLRRMYSALDVVVICSDEEGTPNVLLEAATSGAWVIARDVGDCRRLVTSETGELFDGTRRGLVEFIRRFDGQLSVEERRFQSQRALELFSDFDVGNAIAAHLDKMMSVRSMSG